jgi:filamentous hemagglutinin
MSARARAYQTQITGRTGESFVVDGVKFDGAVPGAYVDAKGPGYANFVNSDGSFYSWWRGSDSLLSQAERQLAVSNGVPIQWSFAEQRAADAAQRLLMQNNIGGVSIVHVPVKP